MNCWVQREDLDTGETIYNVMSRKGTICSVLEPEPLEIGFHKNERAWNPKDIAERIVTMLEGDT